MTVCLSWSLRCQVVGGQMAVTVHTAVTRRGGRSPGGWPVLAGAASPWLQDKRPGSWAAHGRQGPTSAAGGSPCSLTGQSSAG